MARLGSFAAPVDLPEHLRPWSLSGLDFLYLPGGLPHGAQHSVNAAPNQVADSATDPAAGRPASWPEPWAMLAARVRTPPRVIITYASLAADLTGNADPERRKLFQTVLAYLSWPQGTTLFWPVLMDQSPQDSGFFAADIFAQGVRHFEVAHIAAFGAAVFSRCVTLFPQESQKPLVSVHRLPEPEAMSQLLPHELHLALAALKVLKLS